MNEKNYANLNIGAIIGLDILTTRDPTVSPVELGLDLEKIGME